MAGSVEDYARGILGGISGFFGWDTPNDKSTVGTSVASTPPATNAYTQPQTVAPTGTGGSVFSGVPTWALIAGAVLAVGVVVALVEK
ncbi:MAG TPA: hypothetical protein VFL97_05150 [Nitrococcus sp.]|nr:hypothetical protein [Nitrococcus sp.]